MNRRDFLNAATRGAAATAAFATPALAAAGAASSDLYDRLSAQLTATCGALGQRIDGLADDLGQVADRVRHLEFQQQLLLYLLIVSFILDGGLTWLVLHAPVAPIA
jgi:hypothetical protein